MQKKLYRKLEDYINQYDSGIVAFSGGGDSMCLLHIANKVLGTNVKAITISTPLIPEYDKTLAINFCNEHKINHHVINLDTLETINSANNPANGCYLCKKSIYEAINNERLKINYDVIFDGTVLDDLDEHRPGLTALDELKIKTPLADMGITKKDLNEYAKENGLTLPPLSSITCSLSRFPIGKKITKKMIQKIQKAEGILAEAIDDRCRIRYHDNIARIQVDKSNFDKVITLPQGIKKQILDLGFGHLTLDLNEYSRPLKED